jgi:hypothetical protein
MEMLIRYHGKWRRLWNQEAASHQIEILATSYDDLKKNEKSFFINLLNLLGVSYDKSLLEFILIELDSQKREGAYNYRKALANEWQEILTKGQIEKLKKLIASEFPDLFF